VTKFVGSTFLLAVLVLLTPIRVCKSQQSDGKQVELWSNRVVETVAQVASDPQVLEYDLDYYVGLAALALGQNGRTEEALKLFDQIGLNKDEGKRQVALMSLADGLSTGDFVEAALSEASQIDNEKLRETTLVIVSIRQSQRGDFEDAVKLLARLPNQVSRDRAIAQISEELVMVSRYEEAQKLCSSIADQTTRNDVLAKVAKRKAAPSLLDANYVEAKLNDAKGSSFGGSQAELEFLKHFHQAEVAHESKDSQRFEAEARTAQMLALAMTENDGALLRLAGLMFKTKRLDDVKSLYQKLFDKYIAKKDDTPTLDFNQMLFGSGRESDAWIVANCMTDLELKTLIEKLLKRDSTLYVAAPIFGLVVQRSNPSWAEDVYRDARSVKLQAELAANCLLAFARKE
jgi:tetratricopeptide (TPR) repeat protein